jgi:galactokinase
VACAPGRINLIGEHTDYNGGFVLPVALDREVQVAFRRRADLSLHLYSAHHGQAVELGLGPGRPGLQEGASWANYVAGVFWALREAGYAPPGADLAVSGDLPIGAGLSSSAALELAVARAAAALGGWGWDPVAMALAAHKAENAFVGVNCGVMDQFAVAVGEPGTALFLDCRDRSFRSLPLRFGGWAFVVADSGVERSLRASAYNERRAECDQALAALRSLDPAVRTLRDVDEALLDRAAGAGHSDALWLKRARHVVSENARVLKAVRALEAGDAPAFGALMNASHRSLRMDYAVTGPELDALADLAQADPACLGSRMTGAGFGGCTISLVREAEVPDFRRALEDGYLLRTGGVAKTFVFKAGRPARLL